MARKLWEYLIKQEDVREMFIINLFGDKVRLCMNVYICMYVYACLYMHVYRIIVTHAVTPCKTQSAYPLVFPYFLQNFSGSQDASSTILYKDVDTEVSTFCLNSVTMVILSDRVVFNIILC